MTPYHDRLKAGEYAGTAINVSDMKTVQVDSPELEQTEEQLPYACPDCERTFASEHALAVHQGKAHA